MDSKHSTDVASRDPDDECARTQQMRHQLTHAGPSRMIGAIGLHLLVDAYGLRLPIAVLVPLHHRCPPCSSDAPSASASKTSQSSTSLCRHRRSLVPGS